jgi:hypothetical protein
MKTVRDPSQGRLFSAFDGVISETGWKQIKSGWQGLIRHVILEKLPASRLGQDLSDDMGRPSAELFAMCGLLLVREFNNWTVPQTHEAVLFRSDLQYALNLEPGFEISQRTIERYIARLYGDETLAGELFVAITDHLVTELEMSVKKQRLDSTHVMSDMAYFGRTRTMGVAIKRFLTAVEKYQPEDFERVSEPLRSRYMKSSDSRLFGDTSSKEAKQKSRLETAQDLQAVIELFADHALISTWKRYQQLKQVFEQQCEVVENKVEIRKKTGGDVIINVSDPDATYCGNKGQGYQIQLSETCDPENEVNLIVSAQVETAVQNDADAFEPVLEDVADRDLLPETMLADAGYGGDKNMKIADSKGVELVSPVPGGAKYDPEKVGFDKFTVEETADGSLQVTSCPAGHVPEDSVYNKSSDRLAVTMDYDKCSSCELKTSCPIKMKTGKRRNSAKVHFEMREHRAGKRREVEQTDEFRDAYRWRSGIEGTNSCLKRREGLGRLRVRGRLAVASSLLLKIAGWNLLRASTSGALCARISKIIDKLVEMGDLRADITAFRHTKTTWGQKIGPQIALVC